MGMWATGWESLKHYTFWGDTVTMVAVFGQVGIGFCYFIKPTMGSISTSVRKERQYKAHTNGAKQVN